MKPRRYNLHLPASGSRNMQLAHSIGLDASQTASPLEGERESFSLDILSHRITYKHKPLGMLAKTTFMSNSDKNACISTYTFLGQ
jgi:hypothetical protein